MAKKKIDRFQKKIRKSESKKINPFEIKVNKQKHHILGRKLPKNEAGIPGVARSKANKKRKNTLLQEYMQRFKDNQIVDKRIGEKDANLSYEEKMNKRFVAEKKKYLEKRNIFSLNDEEDLTHYGQSLSEIETFEDPINSDDEDYDGRITGKMIAEEHFGGGFLSERKGGTDEDGKKKPWKERMEELITQSRKEKMEQQQVREETIRMTEMVDSEWKTIRFLMSDSNSKLSQDEPKRKVDDYDMNVRSLVFEARAMASNKMKSEKEVAQDEMERLEKLEKNRLLRMKAPWEIEKQKKRQYISADALGDEQFLNPILKDKSKKESKNSKKSVKFSDDIDSNDEEEKEGDEDDNDDDDDDDDEADSDGGDSDSEGDDDNDDGDNDDDDDGDGDNDDDDDGDESDDDVNAKTNKSKLAAEKVGKNDSCKDSTTDEDSSEDEEADAKKFSEISEKAKKELPFTFKAPKTYKALKAELEGQSPNNQMTIIERIQKCNHPSLGDGNKAKLEKLFTFVLTYTMELCNQQDVNLWLVDRLVVKLFQLAQFSHQPAAVSLLEVIKVRQSTLLKIYPGLDMLLLLKLVPILYPASDFRHFVCTPAMIFMSQILSQCMISCERDVAAGLFISTILLQCVSISKRYIPEVMNFLYAVLTLATVERCSIKSLVFLPPFQISNCRPGLLRITDQMHSESVKPIKLSWLVVRDGCKTAKTKKTNDSDKDIVNNENNCSSNNNNDIDKDDNEDDINNQEKDTVSLDSNEFRLSAIHVAVGLLREFCTLYSSLPSFTPIFQPIVSQLNNLPTNKYPQVIQEQISKLLQEINVASQTPHPALIQKIKKKTTSLQLFQPKIEQVSEGYRKKAAGSAEEKERKKLLYKVKQETKGAIREIKKDAQFLAKHQNEEQKARDLERKRKVKAIYSFMESQEADYKKMKRIKEKESK